MNIGTWLIVGVLPILCACAHQDAEDVTLAGRYTGRRLTGRGGLVTIDLALGADSSVTLRHVVMGSPSTWEGTWTRRNEFVLMRLHQVGLDPVLVERTGLTASDVEKICYFYVVIPTAEGVSIFLDVLCHCDEVPGDLRQFVQRIGPGPVKLTRVE